jgi:hypothetical protein
VEGLSAWIPNFMFSHPNILLQRLCRNHRNGMYVILSPSAKLRVNSAKNLVDRQVKRQILRLTPQNDIATQLRGEGGLVGR